MTKLVLMTLLIVGTPAYVTGIWHLAISLSLKRKLLKDKVEHQKWLIDQDRTKYLTEGKSDLWQYVENVTREQMK